MADTRTDAELVLAARSGDQAAFAAIYDRYADRVYGLCTTVTRDRGIAEDATAETFLSAWNRLEQLREPAQLRAWLFAIARNRAIKLGTRAAKLVPTDTVEDTVSTEDTTTVDTSDAAELQQMVWDAAEGLNPPERAVLDLQVRQGLEESEIAQVMGISLDHTYVLTSRMRSGLEKSMAALFIARKSRDDCPELQQVLAGWDGAYSPLVRKRVNRHIEACAVCEEKKRRVNPFAVFGAAPAFAAPFALRQRVLNDLQRVAYKGDWKADRNGFPEASPGSAPRSPWPAIVAAAAVLMIIVGVLGLTLGTLNDGSSAAPTTSTVAPTTTKPATTTAPPESSSTPETTATTTTAPTTTAATPDTQNPTIGAASASPTVIASTECSTSPKVITVTVTATDNVGVTGGTVVTSINGVVRATNALAGSGSSWSTTVGPFPPSAGSGPISIVINVQDAAGNTAAKTLAARMASRCF